MSVGFFPLHKFTKFACPPCYHRFYGAMLFGWAVMSKCITMFHFNRCTDSKVKCDKHSQHCMPAFLFPPPPHSSSSPPPLLRKEKQFEIELEVVLSYLLSIILIHSHICVVSVMMHFMLKYCTTFDTAYIVLGDY